MAPATSVRGTSPRSWRARAFWLGLIVLAWPSPAAAGVPGLKLTWNAPTECPDSTQLEREIERLLGEHGRQAAQRAIEAEVEVERLGSGSFRGRVVIGGSASGSRTLQGVSCAALAMATAVVIALAIEPGAAAPAAPARQREPERPKAKPRPTLPPRTVPFVNAFAGALLGSLPGLVPELGLGAGLTRQRWQAELRFGFAPPQSLGLGMPGGSVELGHWAVMGGGCFALIATTPNTSSVCLGAELERIFAETSGIARPGGDAVLLLSPALGLKSETRLGSRLRLLLAVSSTVRPFHPRFVIDRVRPVYDIPVVGGSLLGGLQLAL